MSTTKNSTKRPRAGRTVIDAKINANVVLAVFVFAIFVSAGLLFAIQPMFTKLILPRLGGAAAVWSIALVFFQTTLLAGYAYAHFLMRLTSARTAIFIHIFVMLVACVALPLHIAQGWGNPPPFDQAFWLLGLFSASIGFPFFALAGNGPLLQAWFARTAHSDAKDPYFLYAASNAGSFLVLISYPLFIEPFSRLSEQTWIWSLAFYVLILLIGACGYLLLQWPGRLIARRESAEIGAVAFTDIAHWVGLAAVPSGLLLAVTTNISTDVAAVPLFWVVPLAIYLLTFVIAFQTQPLIQHALVVKVMPVCIVALTFLILTTLVRSTTGLILIHLSVFFVIALMCHGELARRRPPARFLTSYYMWISFGGMIGGVLVALVAPRLFNSVAEYPILLAVSLLCLPGLAVPKRGTGQYLLFLALGVTALVIFIFDINGQRLENSLMILMVGVLFGLIINFWKKPLPFAVIVGCILFAGAYYGEDTRRRYVVRNFFGVLSASDTVNGRYRVLWHGATAQGTQQVLDNLGKPITGRPEPIAEFFPAAGIAQTVNAVHSRVGGAINIAVVGLGTGALACDAYPGDSITYYELDPDIVRIARDTGLFTYLSGCAPQAQIVQGDARLTLREAPTGSYDLIFIDAFLGAAIPTHLLTREAMALYLSKTKPNGIVALHISNYNLELATVAAGIAQENKLIARFYHGGDVDPIAREHKWIPHVVATARKEEDFGPLAKSEFWPVLVPDPGQRVWTDDYSNVMGAFLRKLRDRDPVVQ